MLKRILAGAAFIGIAAMWAAPGVAQDAPIKRIPLQKFDVQGSNYEAVIGIAELAPGVKIGRHTHPGYESGYVLDGELVLLVDGQPSKSLKPGDSYQISHAAIHDAQAGAKGAKVIATYIVEKGKPLAQPAKPAN